MPKNIVIFSDGTGQRSGLTFDERRSNIYKLFRATRSGPDSQIDPADQVTFYDGGVGTTPPGAGWLARKWNQIYNMICQATGYGLTTNLVETYAAIIRVWEPGDRIFLFGFSRGAYTMRLLGGVLSLCGVPTKRPGGALTIDKAGSENVARRAVTQVYQYYPSKVGTAKQPLTENDKTRLKQRGLLAKKFREEYGSNDKENTNQSNAVPHFIGVFDTVASMRHWFASAIIVAAILALIVLASYLLTLIGGHFWFFFWTLLWVVVSFAAIAYLDSVKIPGGIAEYRWWQTIRFTGYMHFEDTELSHRVPYARHALAIDETRKYFQFVDWDTQGRKNEPDANGALPFEQKWFAGVHTDIGGGYPETESRLSDAALEWMLKDVENKEIGLKLDRSLLNLFNAPDGRQHNEYLANPVWKLAGEKIREINPDDELHWTVKRRYRAPRVPHYDSIRPSRPANLKNHTEVAKWKAEMAQKD